MKDVLLQIDNVTSGYDGGLVLNGASLQLNTAEILGLIGRNGVGKTTLMRSLIGTIPIRQGKILLGETEITHTSPNDGLGWASAMCHKDGRSSPD
ncbi:ATP-binding cassette domain-containing protein [Pectobacteriaceae bacterium CE90]|nr:ATP-binding cassette domain-containing protein [Pectobacteriaceae bacterium CE90]